MIINKNQIRKIIKNKGKQAEQIKQWSFVLDSKILDDCIENAKETLAKNTSESDLFEEVGHYVYWICKLKPFFHNKPDEMHATPTGDNNCLFINEFIALGVAWHIIEKYSEPQIKLKFPSSLFTDWAKSLRYHVYSPQTLAVSYKGLCKNLAQEGHAELG